MVPREVPPWGRDQRGQTNGLHLVSLDDGRELARREQENNVIARRFSRTHGLVVFGQGKLEVIGGPEGDFTIDLPDAGIRSRVVVDPLRGAAVSLDGRLVAFASSGTTKATVVDLESRSIRGILHYAPVWLRVRLAFSPDDERIFAAGMANRSMLSGWRLPAEDLPRIPHWWNDARLFPGGGAVFFYYMRSGRYELEKPPGTRVGSGIVPSDGYNLVGDAPIGVFYAPGSGSVFLQDLAADRLLWRHACGTCLDVSVSVDGSVLAFIGADGLEVWDTRADRRLWKEARRTYVTNCAISRDGRRVAWNQVETARVRDLESGREQTLPLDGPVSDLMFSPDPDELLTVTTRTISLWKAMAGRTIWSRPTVMPFPAQLRWSRERHALIFGSGYQGTEVLDWETGERLALFELLSGVVTPVTGEVYDNDLRGKGVGNVTHWERRAVPQPDETPAAESLARTLQRTGLEFRGVELVAAP